MIIYNTTFFVDPTIEEEWLAWLQNEQIANYLEKNHFSKGVLAKVTSHEQEDAVSYAMQLFCENQEKLMQFRKDILPYLQTESLKKFGTKVLSFETEMLHIKDFESN